MKGSTICLGFTLLSDAPAGGKQVSGQTGHMIGGLDSMQATVVQELLVNEFYDEMNTFLKPVLLRLTELGYINEVSNNGVNPEELEKNRGMLKKEEKTDKNAR